MLDQYIEKLPEADREAFKAIISKAIFVNSRDEADKVIENNPFLKSSREATISRTTEVYDARFKAEKLTGLVEEEIKKRNPAKDPRDIALQDMESKIKKMELDGVLKERKVQAMQKLSEAGLPADLAEFAIHEDESIFASKIERLSGLKAWRDVAVQEALAGKLTQKTPTAGSGKTAPVMSLEAFNELALPDRIAFSKAGGQFE